MVCIDDGFSLLSKKLNICSNEHLNKVPCHLDQTWYNEGMGRPRAKIETEKMLDLLEQGWGQETIAAELGVSKPTIAAKIADLQAKQGVVLKYRALQSIQLTELQCKVLEAITDEKIDEAPLRDLVGAYKILKDRELVIDGKPTEIKGLVAYLVEMERQQLAGESIEPIDVTETSKGGNGDGLGDFKMSDLNLQEGEEATQ